MAVAWLLIASPGPPIVYEGKTLDSWLDAGYEDASRVLHELGPAAAECIFAKLKREDPEYGRWGRYRAVWKRCPAFCQKLLPRPRVSSFDDWRACNALLAIGPRAIPTLCASLKDRHFLVRAVSAQTLGLFRQRGSDIGAAWPALQAALHDPDAGVRHQAEAALGPAATSDPRRATQDRRWGD